MIALQVLYMISGFVALSAGGLQLSKLLKKKNSDEFNLGTWMLWTCTQSVSTAYALHLGDPLLVFIGASWVTFYLMMSVLIIRYSSSHHTLFKSVRPYNRHADEPLPVEVTTDATVALDPLPGNGSA